MERLQPFVRQNKNKTRQQVKITVQYKRQPKDKGERTWSL